MDRRLCAKRIIHPEGSGQVSRNCHLRARTNSKFCYHHTKKGQAAHRQMTARMMKRLAEARQ